MARLLPMAMCAMAALAVVKCGALIQAAAPIAQAEAPATPPAVTPARASPATPPVVATAPPEPEVGANERAVLLDLRKRRIDLDAREATLATREGVAAAANARLAVRIDELDALRRRLEGLETARHDRDETSWRGLVHIYEAMKPKDAAVILDDLEMPVLLQVMDRMRDAKAALVLAAMLPDRARTLTSELAKLRARANAEPAATQPAATQPAATQPAAAEPATAPTKKGVL